MNTAFKPAVLSALIVEDDPFFLQVLEAAILQLDARAVAVTFQTGAEAMGYCDAPKQNMPDLALVDLGLPDMAGMDVVRAVIRRFPATPVMVVTSDAGRERVLEAVACGARGYWLKGDVHLPLTQAIGQLLQGIHPISPALAAYFLQLVEREAARSMPASPELTPKELELLQWLAKGLSYGHIAECMGVAVSTVQSHSRGLFRKLGARSQVQALALAREQKLI